MYLEKEKIFYIHIPRSGGSSVEVAFGLKPPHEVQYRHHSVKQLCEALKVNEAHLKDFKVFTTARNIYTRLVSTYRYRQVIAENNCIELEELSFEDYVNYIYKVLVEDRGGLFYKDPNCTKEAKFLNVDNEQSRYSSYYKGDKSNFIFSMSHVRPMQHWLSGISNSAVFINFDEYANDFSEKVIEGFYTKALPLTQYNKTPNWANLDAVYTSEMKEKVKKIYSWEIEKFNMSI